jgi:hypothetical protein
MIIENKCLVVAQVVLLFHKWSMNYRYKSILPGILNTCRIPAGSGVIFDVQLFSTLAILHRPEIFQLRRQARNCNISQPNLAMMYLF